MNRLRLKEKRKKNIIIISVIVLILLLGASFAFFTYRRSIQAFSLTSNQIKAEFTSGTNQINFTNAYPISDEFALANLDKLDYIDFTVSSLSTSNKDGVQYEIYLKENQTNTLDPRYIKVYLTDDEGNPIVNEKGKEVTPTLYSNLEYTTYEEDINTGKIVYKEGNLGTISKNYRLYIWLDKEYSQNEVSETFGFKVNLYAYNNVVIKTFIQQLKDTPQEDTGIKFYNKSSSTNGEGLYVLSSTSNDEYPIYYYRGNVNNNNIYFAENCWKIVRTTSTGGLKLIYNGEATDVDGKKQCLQTTGTGTQLPTKTAFYSSCDSPAYVGYNLPAASSRYAWLSNTLSSEVYYGSGINQTTYELVDPQTTLDNNHHYSYNSIDIHATGISGDTGNVRYYYNYVPSNSTKGYFIKFAKTKNIQTVLNEMLSEPVSKENPSTIQSYVNTWWSNYDATYGSYLEDTEWCNDRSIGDLGGWNPNGGDLEKNLYFSSYVRYYQTSFGSNPNNIKNTNQPILTCSNTNDRLTVSNGSLTYKIGLLTYDEVAMAGATDVTNRNYYLYTNQEYWLLSPSYFGSVIAVGSRVNSYGYLSNDFVNTSFGARPALSLKLGTTINSGDGTSTNPYIVMTD